MEKNEEVKERMKNFATLNLWYASMFCEIYLKLFGVSTMLESAFLEILHRKTFSALYCPHNGLGYFLIKPIQGLISYHKP